MVKNINKGAFLSFILVLLSLYSFADHILGGEITYKFVSRNATTEAVTYEVTLKIYRDPLNGIVFDPTTQLGAYYESTSTTKTLAKKFPLDLISEGDVSAASPFQTPCTISPGYTISQVVYSGNVTLPKNAMGYHITWGNYARVKNTVNLSATTQGITYYAFIPASNISNNSATFVDIPVTTICTGDSVYVLNTAKDSDPTDVLKYQFSIPYQGYGTMVNPPVPGTLKFPITTVNYSANYNYDNPPGPNGPMGPGGYAYIDAYTGVSTFKAPLTGTYVVLVQVSEYRNGVLVGITRRDLVITAKTCASATRVGPVYSSAGVMVNKFYVKAGDKLHLPITFTAATPNDSVVVTTTSSIFNGFTTNPPATLTGPIKNKAEVNQFVDWQTDCSHISAIPYTVFSSANDNFCPRISPIISKIQIYVIRNAPKITAGPALVCPYQKFVKYTVADSALGSTYKWQVTGGTLNRADGDTVRIDWQNPPAKGRIMVEETNRGGCKDTTYMDVSMDRSLFVTAGADQIVCADDSTTILGPPGGAVAGYTYKWKTIAANSGMNKTTIANPKVALSNVSGADIVNKYILEVNTSDGCYSFDTVKVTIRSRPRVNISGAPLVICKNDNTILTATGASTYKWNEAGSTTVVGTTNPFTVSPAGSTKYEAVGTDNFGCKNTSQNQVSITVNPLPVIDAITNTDSVCVGNIATLTAMGAVNYSWTLQGGSATDTLSKVATYAAKPMASSFYIVTGVDNNKCKNTATVKVNTNALPDIYVVASIDSVCPGSTVRLTPKNGASYLWYNAINPLIPISNLNPYIVHPTVTTTYNITGTDAHGCINKNTKEVFVYDSPQTKPIKGSPYVCTNSKKVSFHVPGGLSSSTYHWTLNRTGKLISSTQGNDTIKVDFNLADTIQITVQETNLHGCVGNVLNYKVIVIADYTPPAPDGIDTLCSRDMGMVEYSAPDGNSDFYYDWRVSSGGTKLMDDSTSTIKIKWNRIGDRLDSIYYIAVSRTAIPACKFTGAKTFLTIYPTPTTGVIRGKFSVCEGSRGIIYEVLGFSGSSYQWIVKGGKLNGVNTKNGISVNWDTAGVKSLKVVEISEFGCPGDTVYATVIVNALPLHIPISGRKTICPSNVNGQKYYVTGLAGSRFVWNTFGGVITKGNNTDTVTINWDFNSSQPYVSVYEISKDSCVGPVNIATILLNDSKAQLVSVSTNEGNDREVNLLWEQSLTPGGLVNRYDLYKRPYGSNAGWQKIGNQIAPTNYIDAAVNTHNFIYEYKYSTINLCNDTSYSAPQNTIRLWASGSDASKKSILKWNNFHNWKRGLQAYQVWRKLDDEAEYSYYDNAGKDTTITFVNGNDGFKHHYRIKAIENTTGKFSWSNDTLLVFDHRVDIPNSFSPNGDGVNDKWEIKDIDVYKGSTVEVFNRWGAIVFSSNNYKNTWDGKSNEGKDLPDATYYYIVKLNGKGEGKDAFSGNITIVR